MSKKKDKYENPLQGKKNAVVYASLGAGLQIYTLAIRRTNRGSQVWRTYFDEADWNGIQAPDLAVDVRKSGCKRRRVR